MPAEDVRALLHGHGMAVASAEHQDAMERAITVSFFTPLSPDKHSRKGDAVVGEERKDVL